MRLFEAIVEANVRAQRGDTKAGFHLEDFAESLPVVALSCIDPRLNPLLPEVLGLREEQFIWLRNAGNIITGPMSSTMRSIALACAVKGGKEIAVLGHTDCLVRQTSMLDLTERFRSLGIERDRLPDNLTEFFGLFASERQNVLRGVEFVRASPLIGPKVPVHGLLVDIKSGGLEWVVNGYQMLDTVAGRLVSALVQAPADAEGDVRPPELHAEPMKFPEGKIGDALVETQKWLSELQTPQPPPIQVKASVKPPTKVPLPPPLRRFEQRFKVRKPS